ncbi:DUF998 domain-containing protein [Cellulomonas sp. McL0617]|uniref:DUF998 domain-containing protein n=1 Tax=Cellulomonas sp. McL0617 TaxID=3415675 RepID=UPI003CEBC064
MRTVPGWALASAIAAPAGMIGGWTLAAARQPSFDPTRETISALAATSATDAWVMTAGLALTGVAHLVTAAGLRPVPRAGRLLLALGGAATLAVAVFPSDAASQAHGTAATIGFVALALWPALSARRGSGILRPAVQVTASAALVGLLGAFGAELARGGDAIGLTERALAGAQALWPLVVVVALRRSAPES